MRIKIKKKKWAVMLAFVLSMVTVFPIGVHAENDYGAVYDKTEELGSEQLSELGERLLPEAAETYGIDLRVDVLTDIEGFNDITEAAEFLYWGGEYGCGEAGYAVTLTIVLTPDETGYEMAEPWDWYLYTGGDSSELNEDGAEYFGLALQTDYMGPADWRGDVDSDREVLAGIVRGFYDLVTSFVENGGVKHTIYDPDGAGRLAAGGLKSEAEPGDSDTLIMETEAAETTESEQEETTAAQTKPETKAASGTEKETAEADAERRETAGNSKDKETQSEKRTEKNVGKILLISAGIGMVLAFLICTILKSGMKSVRKGMEAEDYTAEGGLQLTGHSDRYTHTTTTRKKIEKKEN